MSRSDDVKKLRELLHKRRRDIQRAVSAAQGELTALKNQERDPEYEEGAQTELADYTLSHLIETQRRELVLIDAAFQRMDQQVYGVCVDCEEEIPVERLNALPFALRCEEDARRREAEVLGTPYSAPVGATL